MSMETSTQSRLKLIHTISEKLSPMPHLVKHRSQISYLALSVFAVSYLLSKRDRVVMRMGNSRLGFCKADLRGDFCYKFASQLIKHIFTGIWVAINLKPMMFRILQAVQFDNLHRRLQLPCWSKSTSSTYELTFLDGFWIHHCRTVESVIISVK